MNSCKLPIAYGEFKATSVLFGYCMRAACNVTLSKKASISAVLHEKMHLQASCQVESKQPLLHLLLQSFKSLAHHGIATNGCTKSGLIGHSFSSTYTVPKPDFANTTVIVL